MAGQDWTVRLARGSAVVARHGDVVLLAAPADEAQDRFLATVLAECRAASAEHPDAPGRRLVRKVASLVAQADVDDVPALGLLASLGGDVAALLVGDVDLEISTSTGKEELSGRDVSTWVDRIVRAPFDALSLTAGSAGDVDPRSDLGAGTVTAGGAVISTAGRPDAPAAAAPVVPAPAPAPVVAPQARPVPTPAPQPPTPAPVQEEPATTATPLPEAALPAPGAPLEQTAPAAAAPPARSTAGFQTFSLDEPEEPVAPLPTSDGSPAKEEDDQPQVHGINCSRGHFNDPTAVYCSACGISMVHQTHNLVLGKRPTLGVLVFDDGSVVPLNHDYVLGREPEGASQVADGSATPLQIDDPDLKVSRVHARIQLKDWDVRVVDMGSANGTFVLKKGQDEWTRLVPEEPVTITPGTRVSLGTRTMEFESHHKA
jgi:hypothetical protein